MWYESWELFTSGLSRIQVLSQAFNLCIFFPYFLFSVHFLMSKFSKLLKRLSSLSIGSWNFTSSGTRAQCVPTKAAADCWGPALLCCHMLDPRNASPGAPAIHTAGMTQRLAECHRGRSSACTNRWTNPTSAVAKADKQVQHVQNKWYILTEESYTHEYNWPLQTFCSWENIKQTLHEVFGMIKKPSMALLSQ